MFNVCEQKCDQCLFGKNKIVSDARRKQLLTDCEKRDVHFTCHKFKDVCCRGFYDSQKSSSVQLAQRFQRMGMNVIKWINPNPTKDRHESTSD